MPAKRSTCSVCSHRNIREPLPKPCWICGAFHPKCEAHRIFHWTKRVELAQLEESSTAFAVPESLQIVDLRLELKSIPHPRLAELLNWLQRFRRRLA